MDLEPGVINYEMLTRAITDQNLKGEALRLSKEPIDFGTVKKIRLEFQKILRIDHLWMLTNLTKLSLNYNKIDKVENLEMLSQLTELDLSFNYIEKIENIGSLAKLEVLSLFSNRIESIENLDTLKNLTILNLGCNRISSLGGFERLRFLPNLKVFNLEKNPIGDRLNIREYITAYLPNLKYYSYRYVPQEEKDTAAKSYSRELRELREREREEIEGLEMAQKQIEEEELLAKCFVESLNQHQLYISVFEFVQYPEFSESLVLLKKSFQGDVFEITQKIYRLGLDRQEKRIAEIESFKACINKARRANQKEGQRIIDKLLQVISEGQLPQNEILALIDNTWTLLMEQEVRLFEDIEDETRSFGFIVLDMMNDFIEDAQSYFTQIQELIVNFTTDLTKLLGDYVGQDVVDEQFKDHLLNEDTVQSFVQNILKTQSEKVSDREYLLQERGRKWVQELLGEFKEEEIKRNREKIIEINFFLDQQRLNF